MTYLSPKVMNEIGGIVVDRPDGSSVYLDPDTTDHARALSGEFGEVVAYQPPAPPSEADLLAAEARTKRNTLLTQSDWTQVADAPVDQAAWATYRQALRDVPDQDGFPTDINWPTKP